MDAALHRRTIGGSTEQLHEPAVCLVAIGDSKIGSKLINISRNNELSLILSITSFVNLVP